MIDDCWRITVLLKTLKQKAMFLVFGSKYERSTHTGMDFGDHPREVGKTTQNLLILFCIFKKIKFIVLLNYFIYFISSLEIHLFF